MKSLCLLLLEVIILFCPCLRTSKYLHRVYIDPLRGSDFEKCLTSNEAASSCQTLDWVLHQPQARRNSTAFFLSEGIHYIESSFPAFQGLGDLELRGSNSTLRCLQLGIGLAFIETHNIKMYNLSVCNCSFSPPARSEVDPIVELGNVQAAVSMVLCRNVELDHLNAYDTLNGTSLAMIKASGEISITNSNFGLTYFHENLGFSSGLLIVTELYVSSTTGNTTSTSQESSYFLQNITFYNNSAIDQRPGNFYPQKMLQSSAGQGGGLTLLINGNCSNSKFLVRNCTFLSNQAFQGTGMHIEFQASSSNNSIYIDHCLFLNNKAEKATKYQSVGGGLSIKYFASQNWKGASNIPQNMVVVTKCNFTSNEAFSGGAIAISSVVATDNLFEERLNVEVENTTLFENKAQLGAAIKVVSFTPATDTQVVTVVIANSVFLANSAILDSNSFAPHEQGVGTVYTSNIPISFVGYNLFKDNEGSALAIVGSHVDFTDCAALFTGNSGRNGGAINMLGSAFLLVDNNTDLTFTSNQALFHGGAIANTFTEKQTSNVYRNCFVKHSDPFAHPNKWNAKFTFTANKAAISGASIYSTSLLPCSWASGSENPRMSDVFHWRGWEYHHIDNLLSKDSVDIATAVGHVQSAANSSSSMATVVSVPGRKFKLPLLISDDLFQNTVNSSTTLMVRLVPISGINLSSKHTFMTAKESLELRGTENTNVQVLLKSLGPRSWQINFNVSLEKCPSGYGLNDSTLKCSCYDFGRITRCVDENFECGLRYGYWLGITKTGFEAASCPPSFCKLHIEKGQQYFPMPQHYDNLSESVCSAHREGIICGKCKEGYGVSVTTGQLLCVPCHDSELASNITKYVFVTFLPLVVFFIVLVLFRVRISNGSMNSFAFYMGIFNLRILENLFHPICLHSELNSLDVFELDFAVVCLPLLFVGAAVALFGLIKYFRARLFLKSGKGKSLFKIVKGWPLGESVMHALALYLLLSFSRLIQSSCYVLESNKGFKFIYKYHTSRTFYAGQYLTSEAQYLWRYAAPAYLVLLTSFLFIVILLCPLGRMRKYLYKMKGSSNFFLTKQFGQLLDIYQECFKPDRKYFAGIYFLFRILFGFTILISEHLFHKYLSQLILYILLILLLGLLQPYRMELSHMNVIDILMFTNLTAVTLISQYVWSFNVFYNRNRFSSSVRMRSSQLILAYIPMVTMLTYIVWRSLPGTFRKYFKKRFHGLTANLKKRKRKFLYKIKEFLHLSSEDSNINDEDTLLSSIDRNVSDFESSHDETSGFSRCDGRARVPDLDHSNTQHNEMSSLLESSTSLHKRSSYGGLN